MQVKTYKKAVEYLESFVGKVQFHLDKEFVKHNDPLERTKIFLSLLGNPQNQFKSVLIGGTSGKGSVAVFTANILVQNGYKTGLMVKPHLQKINERIQISDKREVISEKLRTISDQEFVQLLSFIIPAIEKMEKMEIGAPSYFEILTAMGFKLFEKEKVDIAVVEVGMGGEYDATNTLYPLISVITNVSLDHTEYLGNTVEKIAKTKAGIIKKYHVNASVADKNFLGPAIRLSSSENFISSLHISTPIVVTGVHQESVIKIIEEKCKEDGSELYLLNKDFSYKIKRERIDGSIFDLLRHSEGENRPKNLMIDIKISMLGKHQVENASLAIETVLLLKKLGFKINEKDIKLALKTTFFPGRFEIITDGVLSLLGRKYAFILDGAHNPEKMKAFLSALEKLYPKTNKIFIVAFKKGKEIKPMLKQVLNSADTLIATRFYSTTDFAKSLYAAETIDSIKNEVLHIKYTKKEKVIYAENSKKAIEKGIEILNQVEDAQKGIQNDQGLIVVTGSLYLVGEVRNYLKRG